MADETESADTLGGPRDICVVALALPFCSQYADHHSLPIALAIELAEAGHSVTLLWVPRENSEENEKLLQSSRKHYRDHFRVNLELVSQSQDLLPVIEDSPNLRSLNLFFHLRAKAYQCVYFPLEDGLAYYALLAKECGVSRHLPDCFVIAQSPILWRSEKQKFFFDNLRQVYCNHMEEYCAGRADALICTSAHVRSWMESHGWQLSSRTEVILPLGARELRLGEDDKFRPLPNVHPHEIVLCGGLEVPGTLALVCDALDILSTRIDRPVAVTTLGPFSNILGEHTGGALLRRARKWPFQLLFFPKLSPPERLAYVASPRRLAIFPASTWSTNLMVLACLEEGIPFLALKTGGILEYVDPEEIPSSFAEMTADDLASRIAAGLANAPSSLRRSGNLIRARELWLSHCRRHANPASTAPISPSGKSKTKHPLVSIVLVHHDRPRLLEQAINSVIAQDYPSIELILVDDGSKDPESHRILDLLASQFKGRNWQIIRTQNRYLGAARNTGIGKARGEFILFLDDDNSLFSPAVSTFVRAMESSGADICTCLARSYFDDSVPETTSTFTINYYPLGHCLPGGFLANTFGDANAMFRRSVFDAVGYFSEDTGVAGEDWEMFARAVLAGLKLRVIPEPLYWYRSSYSGMWINSHWYDTHRRIFETYKKSSFKGLETSQHLLQSAFSDWQSRKAGAVKLRRQPWESRFSELNSGEPNAGETLEKLATLSATEGRPDTALTLLAHLERHELSGGENSAAPPPLRQGRQLLGDNRSWSTLTELDEKSFRNLQVAHETSEGQAGKVYFDPPNGMILQLERSALLAATLPSECPLGTTRAVAEIFVNSNLSGNVSLLMALVLKDADPLNFARLSSGREVDGSSGWRALDARTDRQTVEFRLNKPTEVPMDLLVALRPTDEAGANAAVVQVSSIRLYRSLVGEWLRAPQLQPTISKSRVHEFTKQDFGRAGLATPYVSKLPLLLFPREGGVFLRPSVEGPVVALIKGGFPALAKEVAGYVEVTHEEASSFEFGMALSIPGIKVDWQSAFPQYVTAFSGWLLVSRKFVHHEIKISRAHVTNTPLDLSLAIRLPAGSSPSPANSYWRRIEIKW